MSHKISSRKTARVESAVKRRAEQKKFVVPEMMPAHAPNSQNRPSSRRMGSRQRVEYAVKRIEQKVAPQNSPQPAHARTSSLVEAEAPVKQAIQRDSPAVE